MTMWHLVSPQGLDIILFGFVLALSIAFLFCAAKRCLFLSIVAFLLYPEASSISILFLILILHQFIFS